MDLIVRRAFEVVAPPSGPTYTPFYTRDFQEGTIGANLQNFSSSSASRPVQYSNDIAGPFGEAKVAKVGLNTGAFNAFGGQFTDWVTKSRASLIGTDVWIRIYHYFPTAFCSGYSTQAGDGYGATKWLRLGFNSDASRMTYQLGGFTSSSCNANGPRVTYVSTEGFPDATGGLYHYFGAGGDYQTGPVIGRDAWHALQLQIHFGDLRSNSYVRAWIDDTYVGQPTANSATLPAGATGWDQLFLGNYWNGGTPSTNSWYVANMIITQETPDTLDSGGRPYISPVTQVSDFD
jgi:hypothetical protein